MLSASARVSADGPAHRIRLASGWSGRRAAHWLLVGALAIAAAISAPQVHAGAGGPSEAGAKLHVAPSNSPGIVNPVKYYIVAIPGTEEREHLFGIAAQTLGDGRRYLEIFDLNRGRLQPDGRRLEDPLVLMPGWILILPSDASGLRVQVGTPPMFGSVIQESPPAAGAQATPPSSDGAVRALALILVVLALGVALHLLRRGQRLSLATPIRTAWHEMTSRHLSPQSAAPARVRPTGVRVQPRESARAPTPVVGVPARPRLEPAMPVPDESHPLLPILADPITPVVSATLHSGSDLITVQLVGARPRVEEAFAWRGGSGPRRRGRAVISIGDSADALFVDLAVSPDVISVNGTRAGVRRQARSMGLQLAAEGVPTVALGDVARVADAATDTIESLSELIDPRGQPPLLVVMIGQLAKSDMPVLHQLINQLQPRVVPVIVGSGPRARWSINISNVGSEDPSRSARRPEPQRRPRSQAWGAVNEGER